MKEMKIRVAITHGDTNSTGYEMILKAFEDPTILELCTPIIYGSSKLATYYANMIGSNSQFLIINSAEEAANGKLNLLNCFGDDEVKVDQGAATKESGKAAMRALEKAIDDSKNGLFDVLVTLPVSRSTISGFQGHSHYMEQRLDETKSISILMNQDLKVALVTNNLAIKDISESITKHKIVEKAKLFHNALKRDMLISNPRIAVLSLNPRCGEDGALGTEEQEVIVPAIQELEEGGIQAFGPYAPDAFFGNGDYFYFDGVLAMYHDQGLIPFKTLCPDEGIRLTSGLPIVRTAPTSGPQFNVESPKDVSPAPLLNAIYSAIDVYRNRANYDEPLSNPLPKLYHEKRDESERVRFRTPFPPHENRANKDEKTTQN